MGGEKGQASHVIMCVSLYSQMRRMINISALLKPLFLSSLMTTQDGSSSTPITNHSKYETSLDHINLIPLRSRFFYNKNLSFRPRKKLFVLHPSTHLIQLFSPTYTLLKSKTMPPPVGEQIAMDWLLSASSPSRLIPNSYSFTMQKPKIEPFLFKNQAMGPVQG